VAKVLMRCFTALVTKKWKVARAMGCIDEKV
jgi:hypothetical protein